MTFVARNSRLVFMMNNMHTRTEVRSCTSYTSRGMCGAEFTAVIAGLDDGYRICPACRTLPTYTYRLTGWYRGEVITIIDGQTMSRGERAAGCTPLATIRRWAANAKTDGVTEIKLRLTRHTAQLGYQDRRYVRL